MKRVFAGTELHWTSVKSKTSEVISNYLHSSERRTHWNICRYNNIPDIHTLHACPIVLIIIDSRNTICEV